MIDYSPRIVEHFANPRNVGEMDDADLKAVVANPVCGDQIHLFARVRDDRLTECSFLAYGCAASIATASILSDEITGRAIDEIEAIDEDAVVEMVGGFAPNHRHCATLAQDVVSALVQDYREGLG